MDYIEFDRNNFKDVRELFSKGNARLLIAEPGPSSYTHNGQTHVYDFWIHLFDKPTFNSPHQEWNGSFHVQRGSTRKGGEDWQTGYENDREYLLRPIREPSGDSLWDACRELGDRLSFQGYEFKIGFQPTVGRGLAKDQGINFCIPRGIPTRPAFERALYIMAGRLNHSITSDKIPREQILPSNLPRIVDYAMKDLSDRMVFAKNIHAGMQADAFLGLGAKPGNN